MTFADLLFKRPIALPKGRIRVIQDGAPPQAKRVNSGTYSTDVRQRIMDLFNDMDSITVPIICGEIGFTAASANRHMARLQGLGEVIKQSNGRQGPGKMVNWVRRFT